MRIGTFEIEHLSEGVFETHDDGSYHKIDSTEITKKADNTFSESYRNKTGIDPILIKTGVQNILVDTGLGWGLDSKSSYLNSSNLRTNLDIFGLTPDDITHVVLTHLHFDHIGGATFVDESISTKATMPYANYFLQKKEWYYALEQVQSSYSNSNYNLDEFYRLAADEKLVFLTDTVFELLPGIELIRTGGHTPGHQIVKIQSNGETAYIFGDLIPDEFHLNSISSKENDIDPIQSKKAKTLLLRQAFQDHATLLFYHSIHTKAGRLFKDVDQQYVLGKVD